MKRGNDVHWPLYFDSFENEDVVGVVNERKRSNSLRLGPLESTTLLEFEYSSALADFSSQTYRSEGITAFYRSYTTALTMNIPFQVTHFVMYEKMQDMTNRDRNYNPWTHIISGAVAGGAAAAVTTPMDVCRTLLNTQQGKTRDDGTALGFPV